jgi:hopene-associated glycosyltransferase HpnB
MIFGIMAFLALAVWCYLAVGRGGFWRCAERDDGAPPSPGVWPRIAVVIPARDEADVIGRCLGSLLRQDYPGAWSVIVVDDNSSDGTADMARSAAADRDARNRLTIVPGAALPHGWTGKLWALGQGIAAAEALDHGVDYFLLSDADIVYAPEMLRWLVAHTISRGTLLSSLMVKLRCESAAERLLIPPFIFFFQMLYPFSWVNRTGRAVAAAAGGCMLVRAGTLRDIGGIAAIRNALIDDCALARNLKRQGPIRLSLTERVHSIRSYPSVQDIRRMVARSAYAQLRYSPLLLAGTIAGMTLVYLLPVVLALFGHGLAQTFGLFAWVLMAIAFLPILRFYRLSPLWGPFLPLIALGYMAFTIDSAYQYTRKRGGLWKGRVQSNVNGVQ